MDKPFQAEKDPNKLYRSDSHPNRSHEQLANVASISNSKNEIATPRLHRYPHPPHKAEVLQVVFGVLRGTP